jgi:DNA-binding transcriptional LysR family regulator
MVQGAVAEALPRFLAAHPHVRVQILVTNRRVDLIEEKVDVALRVRSRLDTDADFQVKPLGRGRMLLAASPEFLRRHGRPTALAELAVLPTLSFNERPNDDAWVLTGPDGAQETVAHEPRLSCGDFAALLEAAMAGTGVALLPDSVIGDAFRSGELEHVLPDWHGGEELIHLIFPARRALLPAVRLFIDFLAETLSAACDALPKVDTVPIRPTITRRA